MGEYIRLTEYKNAKEKEEQFLKAIKEQSQENGQQIRYTANQKDFEKIPGSPIAYWVSDRVKEIFATSQKLGEITNPRKGLVTGNNEIFTKLWQEVNINSMGFGIKNREECIDSFKRWFPYNKGGEYRRWYGNYEYIVNWENDGYLMRNTLHPSGTRPISSNYNLEFIFKPLISWSAVSSSFFSSRISFEGTLCDAGGSACYPQDNITYLLSVLNSKLTMKNLVTMNPTLNFQAGNIASLPIIFPKQESTKITIDDLTQQNIDIAKSEWDSRETPWDFNHSPLLPLSLIKRRESVDMGGGQVWGEMEGRICEPARTVAIEDEVDNVRRGLVRVGSKPTQIKESYKNYCQYWTSQFVQMHKNEEELNRLFIEIYELQDEMTPDVSPEDITLLKQELNDKTGLLNAVYGSNNPVGAESISAQNMESISAQNMESISARNMGNQKKRADMESAPTGNTKNIDTTQFFNKTEIVKQFISYAVGVMMGRYSLDKPGLIMANSDDKLTVSVGADSISAQSDNIAGSKPDQNNRAGLEPAPTIKITDQNGNIRHEIPNATFIPDDDGIIPILDMEYFEDDIVSRFVEVVKVIYGETTLEENLLFIAEALGKKKTETSKECIRRYFLNDFAEDHMKRYKKRPLYWLFQSDKKGKAFNALVYLHRYDENTVGRIRQDYMLKYQNKLDAELTTIAKDIEEATGPERKKLEKEEKLISDKINEIKKYDESVKYFTEHKISLDLDDGVLVNYGKLYDILYQETGLKP